MEYIHDDDCLGRRCVVTAREGNQCKDARGVGVYRHTLFCRTLLKRMNFSRVNE